MKIGILGTGEVGRSLAAGFKKHGHEVKLGHRDPKASYADAAKFGEVVLLCTPWAGTENAIKLTDPKNLAGEVVIDVTNPLKFEESAAPQLALGFTDSGGEQVQRWLPKSRVVKALPANHLLPHDAPFALARRPVRTGPLHHLFGVVHGICMTLDGSRHPR